MKYYGIKIEYNEKSHPPEWTHDGNYKPILTRKMGELLCGVFEKKDMLNMVNKWMNKLKEGDKIILECTTERDE